MRYATFHYKGKTYTLKPKFITDIQNYFRKIKLGWYKKKKVNESKTAHQRMYHMNFKIHIADELNPQVSDFTYEMVVPARAAFFAKIMLERSIKEKVFVEFTNVEEMTEEEHIEFSKTKEKFITSSKETVLD